MALERTSLTLLTLNYPLAGIRKNCNYYFPTKATELVSNFKPPVPISKRYPLETASTAKMMIAIG